MHNMAVCLIVYQLRNAYYKCSMSALLLQLRIREQQTAVAPSRLQRA